MKETARVKISIFSHQIRCGQVIFCLFTKVFLDQITILCLILEIIADKFTLTSKKSTTNQEQIEQTNKMLKSNFYDV